MAIIYDEQERIREARDDLARFLRVLRDESHLALSEVSRLTKIPKSSISNWERGASMPTRIKPLIMLINVYCKERSAYVSRLLEFNILSPSNTLDPLSSLRYLVDKYQQAGGTVPIDVSQKIEKERKSRQQAQEAKLDR